MEEADKKRLKSILEVLLFLSEKPLTAHQARRVLEDLKPAEIQGLFYELSQDYLARESGLEIVEVAEGFELRTRPQYASWVRIFQQVKPVRLSRPSLETLAIVAYKQPVVRAEIDTIRGVDSGGVIKTLCDLRLIRVLGRRNVPGKPLIYGTTKEFLEIFQLKGLEELPLLEDIAPNQDLETQLSLGLEEESSDGTVAESNSLPGDNLPPESGTTDPQGAGDSERPPGDGTRD